MFSQFFIYKFLLIKNSSNFARQMQISYRTDTWYKQQSSPLKLSGNSSLKTDEKPMQQVKADFSRSEELEVLESRIFKSSSLDSRAHRPFFHGVPLQRSLLILIFAFSEIFFLERIYLVYNLFLFMTYTFPISYNLISKIFILNFYLSFYLLQNISFHFFFTLYIANQIHFPFSFNVNILHGSQVTKFRKSKCEKNPHFRQGRMTPLHSNGSTAALGKCLHFVVEPFETTKPRDSG